MAVTRAGFYLQFSEWDLGGGSPYVADTAQDARVDAVLVAAEAQTDRTLFFTTALADQSVMYLAAHLLARSPFARNARVQKSRGDDNLVTGEDIYESTWRRLARQATTGVKRVP